VAVGRDGIPRTHYELSDFDVGHVRTGIRAAAELLAEEIRKTGYMLPSIVTTIEASNSDPDTLTIRYATPVLAGVVLDQDMGDEYGIMSCTGNSISGLYAGDWIYIYDENGGVGEAFMATGVDYHNNTISHDLGPLTRTYPAGSQLLAVESYSFFVGGGGMDNSSQDLMMSHFGGTPEVFAENIETLDFVYYYEDGTSSNQLTNPGQVRMIGINVTAKSLRPDLNSPNGEYRKRDFSLKVKLRNFGLE